MKEETDFILFSVRSEAKISYNFFLSPASLEVFKVFCSVYDDSRVSLNHNRELSLPPLIPAILRSSVFAVLFHIPSYSLLLQSLFSSPPSQSDQFILNLATAVVRGELPLHVTFSFVYTYHFPVPMVN
jgi:hypothetical protein